MRTIQHYGVTIRGETSPVSVLSGNNINTLSFSLNHINPFERVKEAWLYIKVEDNNNNQQPLDNEIQTFVNSYSFITPSYPRTIDNVGNFIVFDVTHIVQNPPIENLIPFSLINKRGSPFLAYPQQSFLETTLYNPFDYFDKQHISSQDIGKFINYKQDIISFLPYVSIPLFSNVLTYPFALVYDSFDCDISKFPLFPKGWKLNILEKLVNITSDSITLIDESFNQRKFIPSTDTSIFLDSSGSGLLIQMDGNDYKLFSPLINGYKLFNQSGLIKKIKLVNDDEINITYNTNSIVITDYRNNTVTVSNTNGLKISSSLLSSQIYTLNVNQDNLLTSLSFVSSLTTNTTLTHSFSYDENDRLEIINSSDGYYASFGPGQNQNYFFTLKFGNNSLVRYGLKDLTYSIEATNFINDVQYLYDLDENRNLISKHENTLEINNNYEFWFINNFVSCMKNSFSLGEKKQLQFSTSTNSDFANEIEFSLNYNQMSTVSKKIYAKTSEALEAGSYFLVAKIEQNKAMPSFEKYRDIKILIDYSFLALDDEVLLNPAIAFVDHFGEKYITCLFKTETIDTKFTFAVLANYGSFKFSNAFVIQLKDSLRGVIHGDALSQYHNSPNSQTVFSDIIKFITYTYPVNNKIYNVTASDLRTNLLLNIKEGFTKYFFTDNLTKLIVFYYPGDNKALKVYMDYDDNPTFVTFETEPFGFVTQDSNGYVLVDEISPVSNYPTRYQITTYRTKFSSTKTKYVIYDFNGNVRVSCTYRGAITTNHFDDTNNNDDGSILLSSVISKTGLPSIESSSTYDSLNRLVSSTSLVGSQSSTFANQYETGLDIVNQVTDGESNTKTLTFSPRYEYVKSISEVIGNSSQALTTTRNNKLMLTNYAASGNFGFSYDSDRNELNKITYSNIGFNPLFSNSPDSSNDTSEKEQGDRFDPIGPGIGDLFIDDDLLTITRTYNNDGTKLIQYTNLKPFTYCKQFDKYGRITRKYAGLNPNIPLFDMTFDHDTSYSDGKLSQIVDTWGNESETTSLTYNSKNRLSQYSVSGFMTYSKSIVYSSPERISSFTENFSSSSITELNLTSILNDFTYDGYEGDVKKVSITLYSNLVSLFNVTQELEKDGYGRMASCVTTASLLYNLGFESVSYFNINNKTSNEIASVTYKQGGTTSYTYDKVGNILSISSTNTNSQSVTYQYDSTYRLTKETHISEGYYIDYTYDINGNILSAVKKNLSNVVISSDLYEYDDKRKDRLKKFNNVTVTYDNAWNPLTLNGATLTYYRGNLLSSHSQFGITTTYKYNGFNIRTFKQVENFLHRYILDGTRIVGETIENVNNSDSKSYIIYLYGLTGVIGMIYNGDEYLFEKDIQGNVLAIYKKNLTSLTLQAKYSYDAYGNHQVLNSDGTVNTSTLFIGNINPFRYRSYYYDDESGFYYCQSRYYVPYLRRWLTLDDLSYLDNKNIYGCNLYAYCNDNPVMYKDESGHEMLALLLAGIIGAVVGAALGGTSCAIYAINNDADSMQILKYALIGAIAGGIAGFGSGVGSSLIAGVLFSSVGTFVTAKSIIGGLSLGFTTGLISGMFQEGMRQYYFEDEINDCKIWQRGIISAGLNTLSTFVGGFAPVPLSLSLKIIFKGVLASSMSCVPGLLLDYLLSDDNDGEEEATTEIGVLVYGN